MWHFIFLPFCHQIPSRSPIYGAIVFPLCFRCAGFYAQLLLSYAFLVLCGGLRWKFPGMRLALAAASLTTGLFLDGWANWLGLWNSPPLVRALTGLAAGAAVSLLLLPLASRNALAEPRVSALAWPLFAGLAFIWLLLHPNSPALFQWQAIACAAGLACLLVNLGLVCRDLRRLPQRISPEP
jgi:uncharacterized membrane protein